MHALIPLEEMARGHENLLAEGPLKPGRLPLVLQGTWWQTTDPQAGMSEHDRPPTSITVRTLILSDQQGLQLWAQAPMHHLLTTAVAEFVSPRVRIVRALAKPREWTRTGWMTEPLRFRTGGCCRWSLATRLGVWTIRAFGGCCLLDGS